MMYYNTITSLTEVAMQLNWPVIATIGLVLLGGGVIFLAQAVEPTRETAVEVLDSERFAR